MRSFDYSTNKDDLPDLSNTKIELRSSSSSTADASPIVLDQTNIYRIRFIPRVVDNDKDSDKSVSGKLIYEKKKKADDKFPSECPESEKISKRSVKTGDWMEISLDTKQTYNLFEGLNQIYQLSNNLNGIPWGTTTFARIDSQYKDYLSILQNDPNAAKMLSTPENFDLVKILLDQISSSDSLDSLRTNLSSLNDTNINNLSESINCEQLIRVKNIIAENMDNNNEETWQSDIFAKYQWVLGQIFSSPCTIYKDKAYVGGKDISNTGGNICDFIYQNKLSKNVTLIEIKTPCTDIVGSIYRGTYSFSKDFSGSINQVLLYKDSLTKSFYSLQNNTDFDVFNPKCVVVIGKISNLNDAQKAAFENYRNNLSNITIIAFDELLRKIENLIEILSKEIDDDTETANPNNTNSNDELPFGFF